MLIFNINYAWLLEGEWKLIEITTNRLYFISYNLFWYITIPFILLLFFKCDQQTKVFA